MSVEKAIKACFQTQNENSVLYYLPADFPAFQGHFENNPLLPAVCQISFCVDCATRLLGKPVELAAVKRAKFTSPALPKSTLQITLTPRPDGYFLAELTEPNQHKKLSQITLQFREINA